DKLKEKHPYSEDFLEEVKNARNMFYTSHNFDDHLENPEEFIEKVDGFIENIRPYGIQDLLRTGPIALTRFVN
ncbi:MAG: hypothetical protein MJB14_14985, partial [Spirochaetes bacterium]|nr:hypothetical protein [Spirochaetota bacterium]